jgi:hypothetical protein
MALPAVVNEAEDSWQEAVTARAASAPSLKAIVLRIGREVDMGASVDEGRLRTGYNSDIYSPGYNPYATWLSPLILPGPRSVSR